jgi:hypothetical protein
MAISSSVLSYRGDGTSTTLSIPVITTVYGDTTYNGMDTCFNATSTIIVVGGGTTFVVQNCGSAALIAGEKILYLPGTLVEAGATCRVVFRVYPNLTTGSFTVQINENDLTQEVSAQICDISGKKVRKGNY